MPYERAAGGYMAARKASKKVINFFVVGLTYGCLRECMEYSFMPSSRHKRFNPFRTPDGVISDIDPVVLPLFIAFNLFDA